MTLSVTLRNSNAPSNAPVAGRVVHTENLQALVRANNPLNFFDLSDEQRTLTKVNDATLTTPQGIVANGDGGVIVQGLNEALLDNFTLSGVFSTQTNAASGSVAWQWLGGNYNGTGLGMGLFSRETVTGATSTLMIRAGFYSRNSSGVAQSRFIDFTIGTGLPLRPATPWCYVAMTQTAASDGNATLRLYVPSLSATPITQLITPANNENYHSAARRLNFAGVFPNMQIAAVPLSGGLDSNAHLAQVKEFRFDSAALTAQQISDQYQETKKWLAADGVVDVSTWL